MWRKRILSILKISGLMLVLSIVSLAVLPHTPLAKSCQSLVVLSGSMEPTIKTGSLILTTATDTSYLQKGDIITFQKDENRDIPVTHRVEEVKDNGSFITKGDANDTIDNIEVLPSQVQGKLLVSIPWLGYVVTFSKSLYGIILLVIIPAFLIIINESKTIKNELGKEFRKKYVKISETKDVNKVVSGAILILFALSLSSGKTIACFSDTEQSTGNKITVGVWDVPPPEPPPIPDKAEDFVVLNEFLPNPMGSGSDGNPRPDGEWVELYNNHDIETFDLLGWYLYDAIDTHDLAITTVNSASFDKNGNLIDDNTTIISPKGFLVVYLNGEYSGWLNNGSGGDTVRLYNEELGETGTLLVDSYTYTGSAADDKTFARIPDGVGAWVDPIPTPGSSNKITSPEAEEPLKESTIEEPEEDKDCHPACIQDGIETVEGQQDTDTNKDVIDDPDILDEELEEDVENSDESETNNDDEGDNDDESEDENNDESEDDNEQDIPDEEEIVDEEDEQEDNNSNLPDEEDNEDLQEPEDEDIPPENLMEP